jgi:hypothetical protein
MDPQRAKKYFDVPSWKPGAVMIVLGLLLLTGGGGAILVGLLLLAGGAGYLYFQYGTRPTDAEIQAEIDKHAAGARSAGMQRLGLDEEQVSLIPPVVIEGPDYALSRTNVKVGKDGIVRAAVNEVVVLFFSETEVHSYKSVRSLLDPHLRRESTDEYFYRDVVAVNTGSQSMRVIVDGKPIETRFETFVLTTSGGTSITCSAYDQGSLNQSIQGMRSLIKQRKLV